MLLVGIVGNLVEVPGEVVEGVRKCGWHLVTSAWKKVSSRWG